MFEKLENSSPSDFDISNMQELAKERHGKCLSAKYEGPFQPLSWQCSEGHIWQARPKNVWNGSWCRRCIYNRKKPNLVDLQSYAESRGGKCLSEFSGRSHGLITWQCSKGHVWQAHSEFVLYYKTWCRACAHDSYRAGIEKMQRIARARQGECLSTLYEKFNSFLKNAPSTV